MSRILELYKDILESKQRFVDEVFESETYRAAMPQLTIIDLGAYEGEFSFFCFNFAKVIYAFEPDPRPYAILEKRIKEYGLGNKVKCFPIALSGGKGERVFHASGHGGSKLLGKGEIEDLANKKIRVSSMSLAEFMEENSIDHVDILKVDIEGGEDEVFTSPDFRGVADKIDCIIGEHLHGVNDLLVSLGFEKGIEQDSNVLYRRKNA